MKALQRLPFLQQPPQPRQHRPGFAREAPSGDAGHPDPRQEEVLAADPVLLEGLARAVGLEEIEFDREAVLGPIDVDLDAGEVEVDARGGKARGECRLIERVSKSERVKGGGS
jgi:hypothetical protein